MGKQGKCSKNSQILQKNRISITKKKKFFRPIHEKCKEEKKVYFVEEMVSESVFETEWSKNNQNNKLIGKIDYEWFSIEASIRVLISTKQFPPCSQQLSCYQTQISEKLQQIKALIQKKHPKIIRKTFDRRIWVIDDGLFDRSIDEERKFSNQEVNNYMKRVICFMSESRAIELVLASFEKPLLLMMSHVGFGCLKALVLKERVDSLEPLEWLNFPNLVSVSIEDCTVSNLKPLQKLLAGPKLNTLIIKNTSAPSFESLSRISTKRGSTLSIITTQQQNKQRNVWTPYEKILIQDICQFSKAETGWSLVMGQQKMCVNRIKQQKVAESMAKGCNFWENQMDEWMDKEDNDWAED